MVSWPVSVLIKGYELWFVVSGYYFISKDFDGRVTLIFRGILYAFLTKVCDQFSSGLDTVNSRRIHSDCWRIRMVDLRAGSVVSSVLLGFVSCRQGSAIPSSLVSSPIDSVDVTRFVWWPLPPGCVYFSRSLDVPQGTQNPTFDFDVHNPTL